MAKPKGGTSNINLTLEDLKDPKLFRLHRKLELMEAQIQQSGSGTSGSGKSATPSSGRPGAAGAAGPPGPSGAAGDPAPNIVTATAVAIYVLASHTIQFGFTGTIDLPVAAAAYIAGHLAQIEVMAIDPDGNGFSVAILDGPWGGTSVTFTGLVGLQPLTDQTWGLKFVCRNEVGSPTDTPLTISVPVTAAAVSAVVGVDASTLSGGDPNYHARWQNPVSGELQMVVNVTISLANDQYPQEVTIWLTKAGVLKWQGWVQINSAAQVVSLGLQGDEHFFVNPPTDGAETWSATAAVGTFATNEDPPAPPLAITSATFSVAPPPAPSATAATGAYIDAITYASGSPFFGYSHLYITLPMADPNFLSASVWLQTGKMVSGVFTPGGANPGSVDRPYGTRMGDWDSLGNHGENWVRVGSTNQVYNFNPNLWPIPQDGNVVHRFKITVASRLNGSTETLQNTWSSALGVSTPGTAAFQDLVVDASLGAFALDIPAPNITSATGPAITFQSWANRTVPVFAGTINLPTGNANYTAHFAQVIVFAVDPTTGDQSEICRYARPAPGVTTIAYSGWNSKVQQGVVSSSGWKLRFVAYNENYSPTNPPIEITGITIFAAAVTVLTGLDAVGSRYADANRSVHAPITVTIQCSFYPQIVSLLLYDGVKNTLLGWYPVNAATTFKVGLEGKETIFAPTANSTWTLRAAIGTWDGSDVDGWRQVGGSGGPVAVSSIPGIFPSSGFAMARMGKPLATGVTNVTYGAGAGGTFPYNRITLPEKTQDWSIPDITYDCSGAFADFNTKSVTVTATDLGAAGNPVGPEHIWGIALPKSDGVVLLGELDGPYGNVATPARTGNIAKVGLKFYSISRLDDNPGAWQDANASTLQANAGGTGVSMVVITVAVGAAVPSGKIPAGALDAATISTGLTQDPLTGDLKLATMAANLGLMNADFTDGLAHWNVNPSMAGIDTGIFYPESPSLRIATTGPNTITSEFFAVVADDEVYVDAFGRGLDVTTYPLYVWLAFYAPNNGFLGDGNGGGGGTGSFGPSLPPTTTTFTRVSTWAKAPANCSKGVVVVEYRSALADPGGGNYYVDHITLKVQVPTGPGTKRDGHGGVQLNTGASLATDAFGGAIVKNASLGEGVFVGGALGTDLSRWSSTKTPYGFYFGLPSASDPNIPAVIINTAETPWRVYNRVSGAWVAQKTQPADLVGGTITALVQLNSPTINGGSLQIVTSSGYILINATAANGYPGVEVRDAVTGATVQVGAGSVKVFANANPNIYTWLTAGTVILSNGSQVKLINATS